MGKPLKPNHCSKCEAHYRSVWHMENCEKDFSLSFTHN